MYIVTHCLLSNNVRILISENVNTINLYFIYSDTRNFDIQLNLSDYTVLRIANKELNSKQPSLLK